MATTDDPMQKLLELAEDRAYQAGIDLCFSVLDDGEVDRAFWTLQIGLLYFLHFWERGSLFEEAPRFTEKAVSLNPANADAHFWHGHIVEIAFRDHQQAMAEFDNCLEIEPGHVYAHLAVAGSNVALEVAKQHLEQVLAVQPRNYRALMMMADTCTRLDQGGAAIAAYERLLENDPYFERDRGVMNRYINTELNYATLREGVTADARKKLDALRRPRL